uniref:Nuclear RNA export factor 1 n=1 Tax=Lygus hesperus TaxID=30085 RepID=A0A0A9WSL9_LYGHE
MPTEISSEIMVALKKSSGLHVAQAAQSHALTKANDPLFWTRCTIKGGSKYDKEAALDAIVKQVSSVAMLLPCLYQVEGEDSFFIFRYGKLPVKRLIDSNWVVHDQTGAIEEPLEISFVLEYITTDEEPYDPLKNIEQVILKRTNLKEGVVDLRNLKNDPDFKNVYVSFNSSSLLDFIMAFLKRTDSTMVLKGLVLSHNGIDNLEMLNHLKKYHNKVDTLDVRHNKLTFSGFERISSFLIIEHLLIDGNPMCDDYESAGEMICEIAGKIGSLKYLDNVEINYIEQFPQKRACMKLFLRNPAYNDLVDHFLHHYFLLFENDREKLIHTYHKSASLSVSVFRNELFHSAAVPTFFASSNRNIMSMSDVTKTYDNIFIGKARVYEALKSMPKMQFDFHTFNVDVPVTAKGELVVISCTGCFCIADEDPIKKYSLSRICIMCPLRNGLGEWLILNDMWTISNVSSKAYPQFSLTRSREVKNDFAVMLNPLLKDKSILISVVSDLTHMKAAWVEKFLSESGWDLEMTLLAFTDQFKANLIPADAFSARAISSE